MKILVPAWSFTDGHMYAGDTSIWNLDTYNNTLSPKLEAPDAEGRFESAGDDLKPAVAGVADQLWDLSDPSLLPSTDSTPELAHVTVTMGSPLATFEIWKCLSREPWEYTKITADIDITCRFMPSDADNMGIYIKADGLLDTHSQLMQLTHGTIDREDTLDELTALAGDGEDVGGSLGATVGNEVSGITESFCSYALNPEYYLYRIAMPVTSPTIRVYNLMFGGVYDLQDGYLRPDSEKTYGFDGPVASLGYSGRVVSDGKYNAGVKRSFTIQWDGVDSVDKERILRIFKMGRSTRPIVVYEDAYSFIYGIMPNCTVENVGADIFNVSLEFKEL